MKKKNLKSLELKKSSISNLNAETLKGGVDYSDGCTDGCTPFQTALNCTKSNCTDDATKGSLNFTVCIIYPL